MGLQRYPASFIVQAYIELDLIEVMEAGIGRMCL